SWQFPRPGLRTGRDAAPALVSSRTSMANNTRPPIAAAILAGGLARRMGGANKASLQIGNERIIDRQLRILRQVADPVFIVASVAEPFQELQVRVVPDIVAGAGPLGGI